MICHSMNVVKKAVTVVNPAQVPVIACDQPLFQIAKQIQWMWPKGVLVFEITKTKTPKFTVKFDLKLGGQDRT